MGTERPTKLEIGFGSLASAADHAVSAPSVGETESLSNAFTMMGLRRVRELTVIDEDRLVVGTLRDPDALRFVAHVARTGKRPAPEGAMEVTNRSPEDSGRRSVCRSVISTRRSSGSRRARVSVAALLAAPHPGVLR